MTSARSDRPWPTLLLALAGLTLLYAGPLGARFLNDDYLFLEQARSQSLARSLTELGALGNYYRPLSRQIYFAVLTPIAAGHPVVFHAFNYALFLGALALLADLLLAVLTPAGAAAGVMYFALLPMQRVLLTWVSCSQDLLALVGVLATLALYRRGQRGWALLPCAAALASKEAALPVAVGLVTWDTLVGRRTLADSVRRAWPIGLLALAWAAIALAMRGQRAAAPLHFDASAFAAAYAHLAQSLVGLEHPGGMIASLARNAPSLLPLLAMAPLAFAVEARRNGAPGGARARDRATLAEPAATATPVPASRLLGFGTAWLVAFAVVTGPVAYSWSAYYYVLAAVGAALIVGTLMRHARSFGLLALLVAMLWIHAGSSGTRAFSFSTASNPWTWTSHLTSFYFDRAATLTDSMSVQLRRAEPDPPPDARFYFATLPTYAGFQMGNGALVRELYAETGIESHFFSQFSDTTAAEHPCRFFYWDGVQLQPLYGPGSDTFFQVGCDLLLLDRTDGALHAFRRGLAAGENRGDLLYWSGWAELWAGRRDAAEQAWTQLGFRDDSLRWVEHLRAAHNALVDGDTLTSRRNLIAAIRYGVGRPEAHAVLGELMAGRAMKYGLLELEVATWLNPRDWLARRELALGLASVRLDDAAGRQLETLLREHPSSATDSAVAGLRRELDRRAPAAGDVAQF